MTGSGTATGTRADRRRGPEDQSSPARWQPLVGALITLASWALALDALTPVLAPGPWQGRALAVLALTLLVPGLARTLVPWRPLTAVLLGLVAGSAGVVVLARGTGALTVWLDDPAAALRGAGGLARTTVPPMEVTAGFEVLVLAACLLLGWACVLMSAGGGDQVGVTALVPGLALLAPAILAARSAPGRTVLLLAGCALLLIATGAPRRGPSSRVRPGPAHRLARALRSGGGRLLVIATALGLAALLVPAVPDAVVVDPVQLRGGSTSADATITLGQDLVGGDDRTVLRYTDQGADGAATSGRSLRLTLAVIRDLDGSTWTPLEAGAPSTTVSELQDPTGTGALTAGGALAAASGSALGLGAGLERVRVTDVALTSERLPTLQSTVLVTDASGTSTSAWRWVPGTTTATTSRASLERGQAYTAVGWTSIDGQDPLGSRPQAARPSAEQLAPYTALPADVTAEVGTTARDVVAAAGASGAQAEAAALAAWFHGNGFTYDESAPGGFDGSGTGATSTPMDTVRAFLQDRSGYCVHYASTFTLMARSLGLPTRIAVGYATRSAGSGTAVTGHELHAWPEVWLDGYGWTAFEPTPGGAGVRADAASTSASSASPTPTGTSASSEPTPSSAAAATASATATAQPGSGSRGAGVGRALAVLGWGGAVVLVLLVPALLRAWERRIRRRRATQGPSPARSAWRELLAEAHDLGMLGRTTRLRAQTPEAVAEALGAVAPGASRPATALARAVVEESYAGPTTPVPGRGRAERADAALGTGTEEIDPEPVADGLTSVPLDGLDAAVSSLRASVPPWRRVLARVAPAGLVIGPWRRHREAPSARG